MKDNPRIRPLVFTLPIAAALALPAVAATPAGAAMDAKCSKRSISTALGGDMVDSKLCRKGFAGGAASNPDFDYSYLVKKVKKNGVMVWKDVKSKYCKPTNKKKVPTKVWKVSCDVS